MYSFLNDYSEGAHPRVLDALYKLNQEQNIGYGEDVHCQKAKEAIKSYLLKDDLDIHFIPGGTQTNLLVISSFLRPHECVIAADTGHINVHETGAVEATGHKVVTMPHIDGKLSPESIEKAIKYHTDEHMVKPGMVYLSDTTELGTIYTKTELTAIRDLCNKYSLILFLDGARLGSALTCDDNDALLSDIAKLVDVFSIGGTKNGALLGEALVIVREDLKKDFRYLIKQRGAMMAKGFVLGIQFEELFRDKLYFELAMHANNMAKRIENTIKDCGYNFYASPGTNQLFPIMPNTLLKKLSKEFRYITFHSVDDDYSVIRLVTSWATSEESVDKLCNFLRSNRN
ncbi:MAG: aminotransferase class I/II-fold pyridoxal phosphate-dependent enzyme [Anaerolineaceae bacterium]|nr:MAG: aminotransferase class I/II-fold pyridoxal phosphate-dependent enzyme [Anaerolineaceae bacterium]